MEKLKLGVAEIVYASGESLSVVYDAINTTHPDGTPHLETFKVGNRRFARPKAVRKWVDFLEAESNAGRPVCYRSRSREARPLTPSAVHKGKRDANAIIVKTGGAR